MALEHIRLAQAARDQLLTLKRRTGVTQWTCFAAGRSADR